MGNIDQAKQEALDAVAAATKAYNEQQRAAREAEYRSITDPLAIELSRKLGELELKLVEEQRLRKVAEYNICNDKGCSRRTPPRKTI